MVQGTVNRIPCQVTIDTGSNISLVRLDVLNHAEAEPCAFQPVTSCLRIVKGGTAPIHGKASVQVGISSHTSSQEVWVADITDECILGLDYLGKHKCRVDLEDDVLFISGQEFPLLRPEHTHAATGDCS